VLGAGANVYGETPPGRRAVFWGRSVRRIARIIFETAARMMSRRHVELTERAGRHLAAIHAAADRGQSGTSGRMKIWMLGSGSNGNAILVECGPCRSSLRLRHRMLRARERSASLQNP
jgi:hypothetical protein